MYEAVFATEPYDFWTRMYRYGAALVVQADSHVFFLLRTLDLGRFVGPIYAIILLVDCLFFIFLEWLIPVCDIDKVDKHWEHERFVEVRCYCYTK